MALEGRTVHDLHERIHDLDKRLEVNFAELRGAINTLASSKEGAHTRIEASIQELDRDVVDLKHQVNRFPRPEDMQVTATIALDNKARLDRMVSVGVGIGIGSSLGGGGVVFALAQLFGAS